MSVAEDMGYRSPPSKLLRFFRRSRDQWKRKCQSAKRENKSLKIRLAKMAESRDRWKAKAQSAAAQEVAFDTQVASRASSSAAKNSVR